MKSLVIAEKPSVARDITRVFHCMKKTPGCIEGNDYIVTWGLGHLIILADPEDYDTKYKEWKMEHLPMMLDHFELGIIKQIGKQYQAVKSQIYRLDVGEIIIATDAGREGKLVACLIPEKAGSKKPIKRLWISSVADKTIKEGFGHLRNGHEYDNPCDVAMCCVEAGWLVGINATRALTRKYNAQLSCGRVQAPTLAMTAKREEDIRAFVPQSYYGITAKHMAPSLTLTWQDGTSKNCCSFDKERIQSLAQKLNTTDGIVKDVKRTPRKTYAPQLYDLTEFQRNANERSDYSAKETLNTMQRLYGNHKVLTYPRIDSRYISTDIVPTLKERLKAISIGPYKKIAGRPAMQPITARPFFVDNAKTSDHHAIIPTEQFVQMDHMTVDEHRIYDLVVCRFLAILRLPFEYEQTTLDINVGGEHFTAKGKTVESQDWKEVYEQDADSYDEEDSEPDIKGQTLPELKKGDKLSRLSVFMTEGETKLPAPFNEATLLSTMENPVAYMEPKDKAMAKTLDEAGGLGTIATWAGIIEKSFASLLLEERGKDIYLTSKAKQLLTLIPENLKKPELTADWEMKLSQIARGSLKRAALMKDIRHYFVELIDDIKSGGGQLRHDNLTSIKCPEYGKRMPLVKGKDGEMLVYQDWECGHRETISCTSNARCPKCHKKMELYSKGDAQIFVCKCGYKEKLTNFQERHKKEGAGVSKKDMAKYLNKQQKEVEQPINSAFAGASAKPNSDK